MNEKNRIEKDIIMFEENLLLLKDRNINKNQQKTIELARQYYSDSKYYLGKNNYFTAFGCINYAHGLLDAIIKF